MSDITPEVFPAMLLWAKSDPWHPLWKHMIDASAVSLALPPLNNGFDSTITALLVGLHDIGKADPVFQHRIPEFSEELVNAGFPATVDKPYRHERLSAHFIRETLHDSMTERDADTVGRAIGAHHGYWDDNPCPPPPAAYRNAWKQLFQLMQTLLGIDRLRISVSENYSAFGMLLSGRIVLCDWIASNEAFFGDERLKNEHDPAVYFEKAQDVAREWIVNLGLGCNPGPGHAAGIVEYTRPVQQVLLDTDIPPGLVIIEAPMGEGKTEAAWILAEKWRDNGYHGVYMALPTMATSDSLYDRYRDGYLKKMGRGEDARLVHGMAWLRDNIEPEMPPVEGEPGDDRSLAATWFRPTRRAMLAAHGVGTIDQAMLAGMHVKFGFLRLYGFDGKVLVIDEVHACDAYMSAIIERLLQWCSCVKIPVILLSATLSARQREAMVNAYGATGGDPGPDAPYPLITVAETGKETWAITAEASSERTLSITGHPGFLGDASKTAVLAETLVADGGCCCIILNTVKQAQAVYQTLRLDPDEKMLFHARFTASDRQKIAARVCSLFGENTAHRPDKYVLVATQVAEQSLDVDFDSMISEIAPIDLLLQRSGRMHRHRTRTVGPTLHVLIPDVRDTEELVWGGTGFVYEQKPLLRTLAILADTGKFHLPHDFRMLIERCYGLDEWEQTAVAWETIKEADKAWEHETEYLHEQGKQFALCAPSPRVFRPVNNDPTGDDNDDGNGWRAKTRLGANDRTAVLIDEKQLPHFERGELPMAEVRALYRRSVKLPGYLPLDKPAKGYCAAVEAKGKLRGLILLSVDGNGFWNGIDEKGNRYEVSYDDKLGLLAGRVQ